MTEERSGESAKSKAQRVMVEYKQALQLVCSMRMSTTCFCSVCTVLHLSAFLRLPSSFVIPPCTRLVALDASLPPLAARPPSAHPQLPVQYNVRPRQSWLCTFLTISIAT